MPFTIRLVDRFVEDSILQPVSIKIDPGSKGTGIAAVLVDDNNTHHVLALIELEHRGAAISKALLTRKAHRKSHRSKLRYRPARFNNRIRPKGWLAPSLRHRVDTTSAWVARLRRLLPVSQLAVERVRFDMQLMADPDISGIEYQNGTLVGTEMREYLLEKWQRTCAYCDAQDVPLEVEHIQPRSCGGSDRVSNLTLACIPCNRAKGSLPVGDFVRDPKRLTRIFAGAKAPMRDAAAVNATRFALHDKLVATGLPVETSTGGRTKWNRTRFGVPKSHVNDAVCVGDCEGVIGWNRPVLLVRCMGRGRYGRTLLDQYGFPRAYLMRTKQVHGFTTGDLVRAVVTKGKKIGTYAGRVAVRSTGYFNIQATSGMVQGISHRACTLLQRGDGYSYEMRAAT